MIKFSLRVNDKKNITAITYKQYSREEVKGILHSEVIPSGLHS